MLTLTDDKLLKFVLILGKSCVAFVWGEKLGWPRTLFIILLTPSLLVYGIQLWGQEYQSSSSIELMRDVSS